MVSSLNMSCYKMLIDKNSEAQNVIILYDIVLKRYMKKGISNNTSSNFEVFVSLQEVDVSLIIIGYSKGDKIFKGEEKCVRKYSRCNKNYWKI